MGFRRHVAIFLLVLSGCSAPRRESPMAAAARIAVDEGIRQVVQSTARLRDPSTRALEGAAPATAQDFVVPEMGERVSDLTRDTQATRILLDVPEASVAALASDGTVLASSGEIPLEPFSRSLQQLPFVRSVLLGGPTVGGSLRVDAVDGPVEVTVVPVRSDGAVVGALALLERRDAIVARIRADVRREGGRLGQIGVCLELASGIACEGVPAPAIAALENGQARVGTSARRIPAAGVRGALVAIRPAESGTLVAIYVPAGRQ